MTKDTLKTPYVIALRLKNLDLRSNLKDVHKLACQLGSVLFLKENQIQNLVNWQNYALDESA